MRVAALVNPVAGLGGTVALKGTDGMVARSLRQGAVPQAGARFRDAMQGLAEMVPGARLTMAAGVMGADWLAGLGLDLDVTAASPLSGTAADTHRATAAMRGADLLVFAGGDGTLRDVLTVWPPATPVLGIPCGVKMQSGVFARSPRTAGRLIADLVSGRVAFTTSEREVMDIDEEALRQGEIAARLFGYALAPDQAGMQAAKSRPRRNDAAEVAEAGRAAAVSLAPGTLAIIGPGRSAGAVSRFLGVQGTLLGVDVLFDGGLVARDVTAAELSRLVAAHVGPLRLIMGVTGGQGFLFGRGNQQIGPDVVLRVGREGLIVLATEDKLAALPEPVLWVDLPDPTASAMLEGYLRVMTGAGRVTMMRVRAA